MFNYIPLLFWDTIWCNRSLVQVMACCLMASSHYMTQSWLAKNTNQYNFSSLDKNNFYPPAWIWVPDSGFPTIVFKFHKFSLVWMDICLPRASDQCVFLWRLGHNPLSISHKIHISKLYLWNHVHFYHDASELNIRNLSIPCQFDPFPFLHRI